MTTDPQVLAVREAFAADVGRAIDNGNTAWSHPGRLQRLQAWYEETRETPSITNEYRRCAIVAGIVANHRLEHVTEIPGASFWICTVCGVSEWDVNVLRLITEGCCKK